MWSASIFVTMLAMTGSRFRNEASDSVGLDHVVLALPQPRVGARGNPGGRRSRRWGPAPGRQDAGHQAGRGGLAMRAGDRDAALQAHEFGQHDGARHDRDAHGARRDDLRIVARAPRWT